MAYLTRTDVLARIRDQIKDSVATYRWDNTTLYRYIFEIERKIVDEHPEAQYVDRVENVAVVLMTDASTNLTISDTWVGQLVDGVAFRVLMEDSDDIPNLILSKTHGATMDKEMV